MHYQPQPRPTAAPRPRPPHQNRRAPAARARLLSCLLLGAGLLGACGSSEADDLTDPTPQRPAGTAPPAPATAPEAPADIVLSAEIEADGNRMARVFPRVSGRVLRVGAELGDQVRPGQVLAVLQSSEIANLQNQHTAGVADLAVARKNLAVAEELHHAGLAAGQDVYRARQQVTQAAATAYKNQRQLAVYGIGTNNLYELRAPLGGYITAKALAPGLHLTPGNLAPAFTVANLDSVWVTASVFEADLARVRRGQAVAITTLSYPDEVRPGRIDRVLPMLDHASKTMRVRCTLPNPGHRLKPGMHAQVRVLTTAIAQ